MEGGRARELSWRKGDEKIRGDEEDKYSQDKYSQCRHICMTEYYSAIKKEGTSVVCDDTGGLEDMILSE